MHLNKILLSFILFKRLDKGPYFYVILVIHRNYESKF